MQLLDPCVAHIIELSNLLLHIFPSKVVQDLLLELQALMADERLLIRGSWHPAEVLTDPIGNQVGLVAVKGGAVGHGLHLAWDGYEELFGWLQWVGEVGVRAALVGFDHTLGVFVVRLPFLFILEHGGIKALHGVRSVVPGFGVRGTRDQHRCDPTPTPSRCQ